jgi:hypothetical protein
MPTRLAPAFRHREVSDHPCAQERRRSLREAIHRFAYSVNTKSWFFATEWHATPHLASFP